MWKVKKGREGRTEKAARKKGNRELWNIYRRLETDVKK